MSQPKFVTLCTAYPSRSILGAWSLCAGSCGIHQVLCEELASKAADLQTEKDDLTQVLTVLGQVIEPVIVL